jgi:hypothetical protein
LTFTGYLKYLYNFPDSTLQIVIAVRLQHTVNSSVKMLLIPFLTTLLTVTAAAIAVPADTPSDLTARACPGRRINWQGGGCERNWGADCRNRCDNAAAGKRCCSGTVTWYQDRGGCLLGWETCECVCKA